MTLGGRYLTDMDLRAAGFKQVGQNVRIHERASIYGAENISLGDHVRIDDFSVIIATGLVDIGSYVSIPNFCFIGGKFGVVMKDFVTLAPGVKIFSSSDDYSGEFMTNPTVPAKFIGGAKGKIILGRHVIIGSGSIILPGCSIGEGSSVGALSLVKKPLPPWGVYAGCPARKIRDRSQNLLKLEAELKKELT